MFSWHILCLKLIQWISFLLNPKSGLVSIEKKPDSLFFLLLQTVGGLERGQSSLFSSKPWCVRCASKRQTSKVMPFKGGKSSIWWLNEVMSASKCFLTLSFPVKNTSCHKKNLCRAENHLSFTFYTVPYFQRACIGSMSRRAKHVE